MDWSGGLSTGAEGGGLEWRVKYRSGGWWSEWVVDWSGVWWIRGLSTGAKGVGLEWRFECMIVGWWIGVEG